MKGDWPAVRLSECADILPGFAFKSSGFTDRAEDIPLVKGSVVQQGYIDWGNSPRWPRAEFKRLQRYELRTDDVVLAMDRPWVEAGLKYGWIRAGDPQSLLVQRVARLRGINGLRSDFLRFVIGSPSFSDYIRPIVTGVNVPHISGEQIGSYRFRLPPKGVQNRVAAVLSAYDDLIENNTRRIAILEEMAQAIYREWFVNFRFPGHEQVEMVESELGPVPRGWRVSTLGHVCSRMHSGGTPSRKQSDFWEDGTINWYKTRELQDSFLFDADERITERAIAQSSARLFPRGTVLMAIYGSPTVGRLGIVTDEASSNQAALGMMANPDLLSQHYLFYTLFSLREHFNSLAQGAAQQNISKQKVEGTSFVLAPQEIIAAFDAQVGPLWSTLENLQQRNRNLRNTRDLLLPRLISGEIEVAALEEELAGAA